MAKHIVCLTFDFDGISGFIARGQTTASWISRGEFTALAFPPADAELIDGLIHASL